MPEDNKFFPRLKTLPNIPARSCVRPFLCHLGPIVREFLIVTFDDKFILLNFSYLAIKESPSDNVTQCGVTFSLNNIFFLYISSISMPLTSKQLFIATPPN